jgi:hypothetical protein
MTKQHILSEIKRTANKNGGVPLGRDRFFQETGIKYYNWYGIYWSRWSEALKEAGFTPNTMQAAYPEEELIEKYVSFVRELGHVPIVGELKLKRRREPSFPTDKVFFSRFKTKNGIVAKARAYCQVHPGFEDILPLLKEKPVDAYSQAVAIEKPAPSDGFVYLLKSGRHYKIGRTNNTGRRQYELDIQLPTKATKVHEIRTDDPSGIEAYWHTRFASKRGNGEWFELSSADVSAFRRRKFM